MSRPPLPSLSALESFEAVVRLRGVSRAADELGVTHGAVSRQVRSLEAAIGRALVRKAGRGVAPTEDGQMLGNALTRCFDEIAATVLKIRERTDGPLVISCEPTLSMRWLLPRLPDIQATVGGRRIHLLAAGGPIDLDTSGVDLAIRRGDFRFSPDIATFRFMEERIGPVCAPRLLSGQRDPLSAIPRLHTATRPSAWMDWAETSGSELPPASSEHTFEHFYMSLEAAAAGLGMAIGPLALVAREIEAGTLAAPFGFTPDGTGYYLLASKRSEEDKITRAMVRCLRALAHHA